MKTKTILAPILSLAVVFAYGQDRNDLKGPAAKNYSVWDKDAPGKMVEFKVAESDVSFPVKKNQIALVENIETTPIKVGDRMRRKGLRSKNQNPWKD